MSVRVLEAKQKSLFAIIQNLYDFSKTVKTIEQKRTFLCRTATLDKLRNEYTEIVENINEKLLSLDDKYLPSFQAIETFDELYCFVKTTEEELRGKHAEIDSHNMSISKHKHKLPFLDLVAFNGDFTSWPLFYQNFKEIIHDNEFLSDSERIQYLVSKLSGPALNIISGTLPIASNYHIIWNLLIDKYQDQRILASQYLDKIFNFKPINNATSQNLDMFTEQYTSAVSAIKLIGLPDLTDYIFLHVALSKLDRDTINLFEQQNRSKKIPNFESLETFIKEQSKILSRTNMQIKPLAHASNRNNFVNYKNKIPHVHSLMINTPSYSNSCVVCKHERHPLYMCQKFRNLDSSARYEIVSKNSFCKNCLGYHSIKQCKSSKTCNICNKKHHSLIHLDNFTLHPRTQKFEKFNSNSHDPILHNNSQANLSRISKDTTPVESNSHSEKIDVSLSANINTEHMCFYNQILPTAKVRVENSFMRILLDSGSTSNFITEECCKRLNLKINYEFGSVQGIGLSSKPILGFTIFTFQSRFDPRCQYTIKAAVLEQITSMIPTSNLDSRMVECFKDIPLADDLFYQASEIHGIIGSGLFPHLLTANKITNPQFNFVAIGSTLGYLIMGESECEINSPQESNSLHAQCENYNDKNYDNNLDDMLQNFWMLESVKPRKILSPEEKQCEHIFKNNVSRDSDGRYVVSLPFCENPNVLGDSFSAAKRSYLALEKKLDDNPQIRSGYNDSIQDYINKGFLVKISESQRTPLAYYIPHKAIYRPDKDTSKIRIVLNASCKTSSKKSLNDILYCGPNLQSNIFDLLINLRLFPVAISGDIEKMFFQLKVHSDHRQFQRILYRFNSRDSIEIYEFQRLTFGLKCSPYLAMRSIRHLANEESNKFPLAANIIPNYLYMDDLIYSVHSPEEALEIYNQLGNMLASGGFNLTKWVSNSSKFLENIPELSRAYKNKNFTSDSEIKIVGLRWNPSEDNFNFKITPKSFATASVTKREILSNTASLYDPLGLLAPVTTGMKLLVQECWKRELSWDEDVPQDITKLWFQIQDELENLSNVKIPRHIGIFENSYVTLLGFSDASEKCYGAAIYIRIGTLDKNASNVSLLCSKSRISPLRKISLARLELCSAHLLALLIQSVTNSIDSRCKFDSIFAFSDSTITLAWITSSPHKWHTFVANRTSAIQEIIAPQSWYHVPGNQNPSDLITRPVTPNQLLNNQTWFSGPLWISLPQNQWPVTALSKSQDLPSEIPEFKAVSLIQVTDPETHPIALLAHRVSKWNKFLNIIVYVLRFIKKLKNTGHIKISEINSAENYVIKYIQTAHFSQEITAIKANKFCRTAIRKLNPFIENDIIRVGGRLQNASLTYEEKHPILLPSKNRIVQILVEQYHVTHCHTGPNLLLSILRHKYWILSARNLVRKVTRACNRCFKTKPKESYPLMGNLPDFRVQEAKSFTKSGVDFMGPLQITLAKRRGVKSQKAYVCLFVCLVTKALHLELVSDLSTEMFLAAFKRFIARRGPVSLIISDGGKNFIGARRYLNEMHSLICSNDFNNEIIRALTPHRIEFRINPPYSPSMGGIWEGNIKCVKTHLLRVIGTQILTYEELNTVLIQIEALLNSRPLCVLSSDSNDLSALTPAHFLNFTPLTFLPAVNVEDQPLNRLQRYALLDKLVQSYWSRFRNEYLTTLQVREKWNKPTTPIKVGQVVILRENNIPPLCWPLAVVEKVYPGKDGVCRVVKVKTRTGSYVRPVLKVCPLPTQ